MLQLDVSRYFIGDNVAHKVRRYKNGGSVGVYFRRWAELASDVNGAFPLEVLDDACLFPSLQTDISDRVHLAYKQIRLRRIFAFHPPASFKVSSGGFL